MHNEESPLAGRVALVTGAGRGMGRAIAQRLHARGAAVAVNDIDDEGVRGVAESMGGRTLVVPADITDSDSVRAMVDRVVHDFGRLDILVNNAGILYPTHLEDIPEEEWRRTLEVNLTAPFLIIQSVIPVMRGNHYGRIINVSSSAGKTVSTLGGAHYTASKTGLLGLTRAAAGELASFGITVNAVCPGLIDTEMARENTSPERLAEYERSFPIQRLGEPEEVAALVSFLASDEAGYITGAALDINGGDLMV